MKQSKKRKQAKKEVAATVRFITTGEVARHCQASVPAVRQWIRDGRLQAFQTPGGHARIEVAEFKRFLERYGMPSYRATEASDDEAPRVLVVEDDPEVVQLIQDFLEVHPRPLEVEAASDGYDALIKVGSFRPDLLILDVVMPRLDGIEVCRRLRAVPETRDVKIIAITGHPEMVQPILTAGADACVPKPFDFRTLSKEVGRLLELLDGRAGRQTDADPDRGR